MKDLAEDVAVMGTAELSEQRALRDDELDRSFDAQPALNRLELRRLRTKYTERLGSPATSDASEPAACRKTKLGRLGRRLRAINKPL
jgi:hypothetical protein